MFVEERRFRRTRMKKQKRTMWILSLFIFCALAFTALVSKWTYDYYIHQLAPMNEYASDLFAGLEQPVVIQGELQEHSAIGTGPSLKIALSTVRDVIDPTIYYEEDSGLVVITTKNKHVHFRTEQLTAMMNEEPVPLQFPVTKEDDVVYLPIDPLIELYGLDVRVSSDTDAVMIWQENELLQWGQILPYSEQDSIPLRVNADLRSKIAADLTAEEEVIILQEEDGWYYVETKEGLLGYVLKSRVTLSEVEQIPVINKEKPFVPWKPLGGKINLTWEAVYNVPPNPESIGEMPGVNVISPTWFELRQDEQGEFYVYNNHADANYVSWAHDREYQVWALFSNSFDPQLTTEMLATYEARMKVIRELLYFAELYQLQGINLDFENVYLHDKDMLTQFVRELTPLMHEQGLVVSMDVTIRGGSEMWSLFYDREALGQIVDYMIVMTYDEHYAASPVAGSVASLPWVEKGMTDIEQHDGVPA